MPAQLLPKTISERVSPAAPQSDRGAVAQGKRFILVGALTASLDYLLLYVLTAHAGFNYFLSAAIGFMAGSVGNYYLSALWVFTPGKHRQEIEFTLFILTSLAGLVLNQFCMWAAVDWLGVNYLVAKVFAIVVVTLWNYISKKRVVFAG
jgi:putative flippase GtrA